MRMSSWLNRFSSRLSRRSQSTRQTAAAQSGDRRRSSTRPVRPACEALEARTLLTSVLLDGTFLDLGINADGSLITATGASGGTGAVFGGTEFFAAGSNIATISVTGNDIVRRNTGPRSPSQMPLVVTDTSAGSVHSVSISGTAGPSLTALQIDRTISFDDSDFTADGGFVRVTVTLTNNGEDDIDDLAWLENFDPTQDPTTGQTLNDVQSEGEFITAVAPTTDFTFAIAHHELDGFLSAEFDTLVADPFDVIDSPDDPDGAQANRSTGFAFDGGSLGEDESVSFDYFLIFATTAENAEDIFVQMSPDFGDAPNSYQTLLVSDGPRHINTGPALGALRDGEPDARFPLNGFGDDVNGNDDEDGVGNPSTIARNAFGSVVVTASDDGMLDAWIDFDANGTFDADEQLGGGSIAVTAGINTIPFAVPSDAPTTATTSYGRFRISTAGGLDVGGEAPDGEVEDIRLTISPGPDCVFVDDDYGNPIAGTPIDGGIFGFDRFSDINTAISVVTEGGTVKVHPGTYNEAVTVPKHVILTGVSGVAADVVIDPSTADGITILSTATTAVVRHLTIVNANDGILSSTPGALTISNVVSDGQADDGLDASGSSFVNVNGGSFSNNTGDGIELADVGTVVLVDVTANGNDPGVYVTGAASFSDTGGTYSNNADDGVYLIDITGDVDFIRTTTDDNDSDLNGSGDGIDITRSSNPVAVGGNLSFTGIRSRQTSAATQQNFGVIVHSLAGTLTVSDSVGPDVSTEVTGNRQSGFVIEDGGTTAAITGGDYSDNGGFLSGHGIALTDFSGDVTVNNATANDTKSLCLPGSLFCLAEAPIGLELDEIGGDVRVTGGEYLRNAVGVLVADADLSVTLTDVTVDDNVRTGALVLRTGSVLVDGGSYSGNLASGIDLRSIQDVVLRDTAANGNGFDGLAIDDTNGQMVSVFESSLSNNGEEGIELDNVGDATIRNVTATGNTSDGLNTNDMDVLRVRGGSFSGIFARDTRAFITLANTVTSTERVDVEANNAITLRSGLDATDQTIRLAANIVPGGDQNFRQNAGGFLRTTNETPSAVVITVNNGLVGGVGDAEIRDISAGTGSGRITINPGRGGIRDFDALGNNLTAAEALLTALDGVGVSGNPIESTLSRVEGSGGNGGFYLNNQGPLTLGNVDAGTTGVSASGDVVVSTASPLVVAENVTSLADVTLTSHDGASFGDDLTVKTTITVMAGNDVTLSAGDNLLLEDSSTVAAPTGTVYLSGDEPNADPGTGSQIDVFGTITSAGLAVITGGTDRDRITIDPGVGHTVDAARLDGFGGSDVYRVFYGRLNGGLNAITISDTGGGGNDRGRFIGTQGLAEVFSLTNNEPNGSPQTGGSVLSVNESERINYTQTLERFTVQGRGRSDTFNAQPSQTAEITVDGDNPSFGDPNVPPGDTLNLDPLGNTFVVDGKSILTNGGSPNPFAPVNFRDIENFPLAPQGTSDPISFDFDHSNTASSVATSPTQPGYVSVLRDTLHSGGLGYGWESAVRSFERDDGYYNGPFEALIRDGNWLDGNRVFTVDLDNGWYSVDVTLGNAYSSTPGQEIRNADTFDVLASGVNSPPAVSTQATFAVLVEDGTLDLEFIQPVGNPDIFSVNGIAIRPANLLTMGLNLSGVGSLGADGVTTDTFRLHEAPANSYVTVSTDLGEIVNTDADPEIDGLQVLTDSNGQADILIRRPTGMGQALVKFVDVNGQGIGCSTLTYVLPDTRNFDFNDGHQVDIGVFEADSPTQAPIATGAFPGGFLGVLGTDGYSSQEGFGWISNPDSFDDGVLMGPLQDLRRDGVSSDSAHVFRVDLPPGVYEALATVGDSQDHEGLSVDVNGVNAVAGVSTTATNHVQVPFGFTVGNNGQAEFTFSDTDSTPYWAVNGLQIRPREDVAPFTFTPDIGSVPADGLTIATVQATTTVTNGEEVTVSTSAGTIITPDVNELIEGVQVEVSGGVIVFDILAPGTPSTPTLTATALDGEHHTVISDPALLEFTLAPSRRYDFNHTYSADGPGPSITAAGFIGVLRTDRDPSSGHGWLVSPNSFDAGVPNDDDDSQSNAFSVLTTDLYRDYHSGHQVLGSRTFRVQVDSGTKYDGTVYVGSQNFDASTKVTIEGIAVPTTTETVGGQFVAVPFTDAMDMGSDGFIDITFAAGGGASPLWATSGIDIVEQGQPLPLPAPIVAADRLPGGLVDRIDQIDIDRSIVIAIAAWEDSGATPAEIALLESTPVIVRDFGRNGALGLATPLGQVVIDDDGAGHGWSPILDVPTSDRYDLVTVLAHEYGHILGRPDVDPVANPEDLMSAYLYRGERNDSLNGTDDFFTAAIAEHLPFD